MFRFPRTPAVALALAACCLTSGCVSRRLTIRTNPQGALVEVDGTRLGHSPVSMDFTHYGTREIKVSAPGYETRTVQQPVSAPFYQYVPLDFVTNHFLPFRVTDRRDVMINLEPKRIQIDEEQSLIERGRDFRSQSQTGGVP